MCGKPKKMRAMSKMGMVVSRARMNKRTATRPDRARGAVGCGVHCPAGGRRKNVKKGKEVMTQENKEEGVVNKRRRRSEVENGVGKGGKETKSA